MFDLTCLTMKDPPANKTWDCKDIDNYQCGSLDQVFQCDNGGCVNMTSVYNCRIDGATATNISYDCNNRKNCITLSGLLYCQVVSYLQLTNNITETKTKTLRKEFAIKYLSHTTAGEFVMVLK